MLEQGEMRIALGGHSGPGRGKNGGGTEKRFPAGGNAVKRGNGNGNPTQAKKNGKKNRAGENRPGGGKENKRMEGAFTKGKLSTTISRQTGLLKDLPRD